MRIVSGKHRGRRIEAPPGKNTRPTTDQVRESLFNVLQHGGFGDDPVDNAYVLDVFCGTGALGLEAISRGAADVVFMDKAPPALKAVRTNVETLGEGDNALILRADAARPGKRPDKWAARDLVFLDPPYGKKLGEAALVGLARRSWLADDALVIFEESAKAKITLPDGYTTIEKREFGDTVIRFCRYSVDGSDGASGGGSTGGS